MAPPGTNLPKTREEFKAYLLRKLGHPVIQINVSDEQIEDRIDDALSYFYTNHYDGSTVVYYKHLVTQEDKDNKYITLPPNIIGAVRVFDLNTGSYSAGMFSMEYQIALNDLYTLTSQSMLPYYMMQYQVQQMQKLLVGMKPIRFNRYDQKVYLDTNWGRFNEGAYLIVEAYQVVNPELYENAWSDIWLTRYATCLVKVQWGENLTKFIGGVLPGGVQFNGNRILSDAQNEKIQLENEMIDMYTAPVQIFLG